LKNLKFQRRGRVEGLFRKHQIGIKSPRCLEGGGPADLSVKAKKLHYIHQEVGKNFFRRMSLNRVSRTWVSKTLRRRPILIKSGKLPKEGLTRFND